MEETNVFEFERRWADEAVDAQQAATVKSRSEMMMVMMEDGQGRMAS